MRSKSFLGRKIAVWQTNSKLRENAQKRAKTQWEERAQKNLERAIGKYMIRTRGAKSDAAAQELAQNIMIDTLVHIYKHGPKKGPVLRRQAIQEYMNRMRGSQKSPYKLSGIEKNEDWLNAVGGSIENKEYRENGNAKILHGREAAEILALEKWLKKSPEHKNEMAKWVVKHRAAKRPMSGK